MSAKEKLIAIIAEQLGLAEEDVTLDSSFAQDLGADTLDKIELVLVIEDEFGVAIPSDEMNNLVTVGDLLARIERAFQ